MTSRPNPRRSDQRSVHTEQHLGPVLRLGAASAGVNGDDGVLPVELAREHRADLAGLNVPAVRLEPTFEVRRHVFALARPIDQHPKVVTLFPQCFRKRPVVLETTAALLDALGVCLVFPEVRRGGFGFDVGQFPEKPGFVKAPSASLRRDRPGLRANGPTRPTSWSCRTVPHLTISPAVANPPATPSPWPRATSTRRCLPPRCTTCGPTAAGHRRSPPPARTNPSASGRGRTDRRRH